MELTETKSYKEKRSRSPSWICYDIIGFFAMLRWTFGKRFLHIHNSHNFVIICKFKSRFRFLSNCSIVQRRQPNCLFQTFDSSVPLNIRFRSSSTHQLFTKTSHHNDIILFINCHLVWNNECWLDSSFELKLKLNDILIGWFLFSFEILFNAWENSSPKYISQSQIKLNMVHVEQIKKNTVMQVSFSRFSSEKVKVYSKLCRCKSIDVQKRWLENMDLYGFWRVHA